MMDLLIKMSERLERMDTRLEGVESQLKGIDTRLIRVEDTVNRIEASQAEDVISMLKLQKKKTDFEVEYLNNRITEMDKRLFNIEKSIEN
ncbi:hypothetical protein CYOC110262_22325 [Cytobacillus oceanisediminis]|uniref:Uncharacterized protein n=2 Tax=Cytobacillus oceanisediminis TaxID=665099 RepID=A0A562J8U9_9BACI|nr:hypothetical protein IQ19_04841 [Cytobacillus oceanisediminis]